MAQEKNRIVIRVVNIRQGQHITCTGMNVYRIRNPLSVMTADNHLIQEIFIVTGNKRECWLLHIDLHVFLWHFLRRNQAILYKHVYVSIAVSSKDNKNMDGICSYKLQLFKICGYASFYRLLLIKKFSKIAYYC